MVLEATAEETQPKAIILNTMVPNPEDVINRLSDYDIETKLKAVKSLKNEIIGSKNKKLSYIQLGAVPKIVQILASQNDSRLVIQAAATLGSLSYGLDEGVQAIREINGVAHLLKILSHNDEKVLEASVRSLKMIFQSPLSARDTIFTHPALKKLISLLESPRRSFSEASACILAHCCQTKNHQQQLLQDGALKGLLNLLKSPYRKCQSAALHALSSMSRKNADVCREMIQNDDTLLIEEILTKYTKDRSAEVRLLACACLTNLSTVLSKREFKEIHPQVSFYILDDCHEDKHVLQVLVKLLDDKTVWDKVPEVISNLTKKRTDLQRAAYNMNAVNRLCVFLSEAHAKQHGSISTEMRKGVLKALGTLCYDLHDTRRQIDNCRAIKPIIESLEDASAAVRAAAAHCVWGMTRSVKDLRSEWIDVSTTIPIIKLLNDPSTKVQIKACATMCNILMEFNRVKELCIEKGLKQMINLTQAKDNELRLNAIFAFKNLAFQLHIDKRKQVLNELPWKYIRDLINDMEPNIQEQALRFLQNMCNSDHVIIEEVMTWCSGEMLQFIHQKIKNRKECAPGVVAAALRVASNISTGNANHQKAIMQSKIPLQLGDCLQDKRLTEVRLAAVWCIINLTWRDELPMGGQGAEDAKNRAEELRDIGIENVLQNMQDDESLDVQERVKTALGFFREIDIY